MGDESELFVILSDTINSDILHDLLNEYSQVKNNNWLGDAEKCILHAGKFSELVLGAITELSTRQRINLNKLEFQEMFDNLITRSKPTPTDEILLLVVPRVAQSVYSIRSKKGVAHVKGIDPDFIDALYASSACDWIMAQLLILLCKSKPERAYELAESIVKKQVPFVEQFESGELVVLRTDLTHGDEVLVVLYHLYPRRVSRKELDYQMKPKYPQLTTTTLAALEKKRLIHRNESGISLTRLGISRVEGLFLRRTESS